MHNVLITGGTGSFGQAFVRRCLANEDYERVCVLSRDEQKQAVMAAQLAIEFPEQSKRLRFFIGDVRDKERLGRAFEGIWCVVHAVALKIIPASEYNPRESVLTNIFGTMNVIDAAIDRGVKKVVFLSSDKAAAPVNLYGKCKAVSESLISQANVYSHNTRFASTRYGNVLGSRGSVIQLWQQQLKDKGAIDLTNPMMTRFFMTVQQACELVENALVDMVGGETFIPKIISCDLATLATAWNPDAPWNIINLRPGEKLHEELISENESARTLAQANRYVVLPSAKEWVTKPIAGEAVSDGFSYNSFNNPNKIEDVREMTKWLSEACV